MNDYILKCRFEQLITQREAMVWANKNAEFDHERPPFQQWQFDVLMNDFQNLRLDIQNYIVAEERKQTPKKKGAPPKVGRSMEPI